jgi:ABC-type tungstate transport system substrate-binding protein
MIVLGTALVALPFVLMFAFNGLNRADSRGKRVNRQWRTHH